MKMVRLMEWLVLIVGLLVVVGAGAFVAAFFFDGNLYTLDSVTGERCLVDYSEEPELRDEVLAGRLKVTRDWHAYHWQRRLGGISAVCFVVAFGLWVFIRATLNGRAT